MIDTHCHLTDPRLRSQLDGVLQRASAAGVDRMITVSTTISDAAECVELCRGRDHLRCAVGIHPHHAAEADLAQLPLLEKLAGDRSVVAVGEIGLDFHYDFSPRQRQQSVFEAQLEMACRVGKPLMLHCREAVDLCLKILQKFPPMPAVFHCFTGTTSEAKMILERGYYLGFAGILTFKKSQELRQVLCLAPAERILLETDAPYLAPEPFRGQKVNEPALKVHTGKEAARVRKVSVEQIKNLTLQNARRLFKWE